MDKHLDCFFLDDVNFIPKVSNFFTPDYCYSSLPVSALMMLDAKATANHQSA